MSQKAGTNTKLEKFLGTSNVLTNKLSYTSKKAYNYKWAEECAAYIRSLGSNKNFEDKARRYKLNYDLANGRGDEFLDIQSQTEIQTWNGQKISSGSYPVRHLPMINEIIDAMGGVQLQSRLKFTAIDSSGYSTTMRQKKRLELNQSWINDNIISPLQQQIAMQVMIENGVNEQSKLSPEDQQDLKSDIDNRLKFKLIEDIDSYMSKDYKTPPETEVQKLVNWLVKETDFKFITDRGFREDVLCTGSEFYRILIRNNKPVLEKVDTIGFERWAAKDKMFVEDSDIIRYNKSVTYQDVLNWHGTELLKSKQYDKLEISSTNRNYMDDVVGRKGGELIIKNHPPINTPEGQRYAKVLDTIFGNSRPLGEIDYTHYVWKSFTKMKAITRKEKMGLQIYYVDENYQFNPMKGDVEETIEIVPEIYQCTEVGNDIYLEKGPLPYQYRSPQDPFNVKMNYVGGFYNTLGGNSENRAPIDLGKPFQHQINLQAHKINELDRKNKGTILHLPKQALTNSADINETLSLIKNESLLITDNLADGMGSNEINSIKAIQLDNLNEIQQRSQYIDSLKNQMALAMGFNPSRLGMQNPSLSVTNNRQNIIQSTIQTEAIYKTHNKIIENLINYMVNVAKICLSDNPIKASYVLDDMSIAELSLDENLLNIAEQNIYVSNSIEDQDAIDGINNLAQPLIQNGQMDFEDAIRLRFSKNPGDMINIAKDSIRKNQNRIQQQQEMEQQLMQQQSQMQQQMDNLKFQMELEKQKRDLEAKILIATISSENDRLKLASAYDIDKNNINDVYEANQKDIEFKDRELLKKMDLEDRKLKQEKELTIEELKVKKQQIMSKPKSKN